MGVDLHAHTTASDGTDSPARVVESAAALGLSAVAVTDHDTTEGLEEAAAAAIEVGVELVAGVELSLEWGRGTMHLLALLVDDAAWLSSRLEEVRRGRVSRNLEMVERLQAQGVAITIEEVRAESSRGTVGRPHFASVLVRKGYAADIGEAFLRHLGRGCPAYVERRRIAPSEAIALAHRAGGVAVLAHPLTLGVEGPDLSALLGELAAQGLDGVEAHYGAYRRSTRSALAALARRHGLIPSGGSDYHGRFKPEISLGVGRGDLVVPEQVLAELREAADRHPAPRVGVAP